MIYPDILQVQWPLCLIVTHTVTHIVTHLVTHLDNLHNSVTHTCDMHTLYTCSIMGCNTVLTELSLHNTEPPHPYCQDCIDCILPCHTGPLPYSLHCWVTQPLHFPAIDTGYHILYGISSSGYSAITLSCL